VIRHMGVLIDRCGAIGGRLGGEEFAIFLENCGRVEGLAVAEALRADVAKSEFTTQSDVMQVTVSIGLAELLVGDSLRTLLKRADQALYAAKDGGRNRVVVSSAVTCLQDVA